MRVLGVILIILGLVGLIYGGFTYFQKQDTADLGIAEVTVKETAGSVNIHPAIGGVILAAGIVMVVAGGRRKTEHRTEHVERIEIDQRQA